MSDQLRWVKIAGTVAELPIGANNLAEIIVKGKKVCIGNWGGELFAFIPSCPHAGGPFSKGFIDVLGNVVCPLHRYKFCLKNGRNVSGEGYYLKRWPVKVNEEGVFIGFDKGVFENLL